MYGRIALVSVNGDPSAVIGAEEAGGQNVYVREVGRHLASLGYEVDMFTRRIDKTQPEIVEEAPNCRTIRLAAGPLEFVRRDDLHTYIPHFIESLTPYVKRRGYTAIHTHYWHSGIVGLAMGDRFGVPVVHTYHSLGAIKYMNVAEVPPSAQLRLSGERRILEQADRVVATSPQEAEHMRSYVSHKGLIDIIPCGVDVSHFSRVDRAQARQELGFDENEKVVLYVGRFDKRKGIETLVRAVAQMSEPVRLVIGGGYTSDRGDGQEFERIRSIVDEVGIADRTRFAGRIDQADLPAYYTAADVCVVPSHYEPFGLVAIEAMACGTPVVASAVGGLCYSVVDGQTGLLVPPHDADRFAAAIGRIIANPNLRSELSRASVQRIHSHFTWAGVSRRLGRLFEHLAARKLKVRAASQSVA
ncbi:glycosyltransferase family 4 protein [Gloeobacter kilaueensis]|uniref:Glycosyl transferase group 1 n=1 Tax=Gloeobacter kilaueensis (strain ATCC BAA-2537 / CCAP 1431/1 / ULC 316 / JS1) TaxID=1183438 RepID=U5QN62_GLOK1|nr:glycosyltransferase family 1 protein [Gloeobacter kilaueensis]AGY60351.1 glycosyl transferase group 1 [Gloeobacter kilaueensis JS1]